MKSQSPFTILTLLWRAWTFYARLLLGSLPSAWPKKCFLKWWSSKRHPWWVISSCAEDRVWVCLAEALGRWFVLSSTHQNGRLSSAGTHLPRGPCLEVGSGHRAPECSGGCTGVPAGGREPLLMCFARSLSTAPPWLSGCRPRFRDDVTLPGTHWTTANEGSRILSSVSALSLYW